MFLLKFYCTTSGKHHALLDVKSKCSQFWAKKLQRNITTSWLQPISRSCRAFLSVQSGCIATAGEQNCGNRTKPIHPINSKLIIYLLRTTLVSGRSDHLNTVNRSYIFTNFIISILKLTIV